jgi:cellulose synthase/poly-beta-1,6-N-acetylglucosamine synthase-like glycosyltransferase
LPQRLKLTPDVANHGALLKIALAILITSTAFVTYPYLLYPLLLKLLASVRPARREYAEPDEWPTISITVPVYNEEGVIRSTLESLLRLEYPADRRQILIVSDASSDRTDEIIAEYAEQGIEFMRLPFRQGKTAAENAARSALRGEIIVNSDATIRIHPKALKPLIAAFSDPSVGVASGRDVSVAHLGDDSNVGESGYVDYEMRVRALETGIWGIVGASGCFYSIRSEVHNKAVPPALSRDFAAALNAREAGYRAVSVDEAVCFVPRTGSLRREYGRKVRTIARGIETLIYKRGLLNPFRFGLFAWMLFSHKLCRWLVPWAGVLVGVSLVVLAATQPWARAFLAVAAVGLALGWVGWIWPPTRNPPRLFALPAFALLGNLAVLHAWTNVLRREFTPTWEPTRRGGG